MYAYILALLHTYLLYDFLVDAGSNFATVMALTWKMTVYLVKVLQESTFTIIIAQSLT
jgi:hypothetical protein